MKTVVRILLLTMLFAGYAAIAQQQQCVFLPATPPGVPAGGTVQVSASCGANTQYSIACSGPACPMASVDSTTGLVTMAPVIHATNYSRGCQLLPMNSLMNYRVSGLPVARMSSVWMGAIATDFHNSHLYKLGEPPRMSLNDLNNVVHAGTPLQKNHAVFSNPTQQDAMFPTPQYPYLQQGGASVDPYGCRIGGCPGPDRHHLISDDSCTEWEDYQQMPGSYNVVVTASTIAFDTDWIKQQIQTPISTQLNGVTGSAACTALNFTPGGTMAQTHLLPVLSQTPASNGHVQHVVLQNTLNIAGCGVGSVTLAFSSSNIPTANVGTMAVWSPASNDMFKGSGTDAIGSPIAASSLDPVAWVNRVANHQVDSVSGKVLSRYNALRTTLPNIDISPRDAGLSVNGSAVTFSHPWMGVSCQNAANPQCTSATDVSTYSPCEPRGWTGGCTGHVAFQGLTGQWATLNDNKYHTNDIQVVYLSQFHFQLVGVDTTNWGTQTWTPVKFTFGWLPYGQVIRLQNSFNAESWTAANCTAASAPYAAAELNAGKEFGWYNSDGTDANDAWSSGLLSSKYYPDVVVDALNCLKKLTNWEQYLEIPDLSSAQLYPNADTTVAGNQYAATNYNRVTVTATGSTGTSSMDILPIPTGLKLDPERMTIIAGGRFAAYAAVTGNVNGAYGCVLQPAVPGASVAVSGTAVTITAPATVPATGLHTAMLCTSSVDAQAQGRMTVDFAPVSSDGAVRLAMGQQAISPWVDSLGFAWLSQEVKRVFNSAYENATGSVFAALNGTWDNNAAQWANTVDAQKYAMSLSTQEDTEITSAGYAPGPATVWLYAEPGYGITAAGEDVWDCEAQGKLCAGLQVQNNTTGTWGPLSPSWIDGFVVAGNKQFAPITMQFPVVIGSDGVLNVTGRIRQLDKNGHGMSLSSMKVIPGGQQQPALTVTVQPSTVNIQQGAQAETSVTIQGSGGFSGAATPSVSGLPAGVTASFAPAAVQVPGSSVLTLTASTQAAVGTYQLQVQATGNGVVSNSVQLTLKVAQQIVQSIKLLATPAVVSLQQGLTNTAIKLVVTVSSGYSSDVALAVSNLPQGVSVSISPSTLPAPGNGTAAVTLRAGPTAKVGSYTLTAKATGAGVVPSTTTIVLNITIPGGGLTIATKKLAPGTVGKPYQQLLLATGGKQPYTWKAGTPLPAGLKLAGGLLTGTPLVAGTFKVTLVVVDSAQVSKSVILSVTIK